MKTKLNFLLHTAFSVLRCDEASFETRALREKAMNNRVRHLLGSFVMVIAMAAPFVRSGLGANVPIRPGTVVEFASVAEGQAILGARDAFIQTLTPLDRSMRMKTNGRVSESQFMAFVTNQVRAWTASEQTKITTNLNTISGLMADLNVSFPSVVPLIKTTGNEEGQAAYVRGKAIILPQAMVNYIPTMLRHLLIHELFHVYMIQNPHLDPALYRILGFLPCGEIALPPPLNDLRITGPEPWRHHLFITVKLGKERIPAVPVLYFRSTNYTGGVFFDYLESRLLALEQSGDGYRASITSNGEPRLLAYRNVTDFWEQIGQNTGYNILPEETLAENFDKLVSGYQDMPSPRVMYMLRCTINNPNWLSPRLLSGRYSGYLETSPGATLTVEASTDLVTWRPWDYVSNAPGSLEVVDSEAWLFPERFFRARPDERPALEPGDTNQMVWIPPGTFTMGSPATEVRRSADEGPQTAVTLPNGFWMGRFEVTQGEYETVMSTNTSWFRGDKYLPADQVTWAQAVDYCARLTEREEAAGRLPAGWTYRLPTEAEWEYAARAGTMTRFSFGNDWDYRQIYLHAWFQDTASMHTHPAGLKNPNPWGLNDIYGNVSEWCSDWYAAYPGGDVVSPQGPGSGTNRTYRGCGYGLPPRYSRSAKRGNAPPTVHSYDMGLRIILAPRAP